MHWDAPSWAAIVMAFLCVTSMSLLAFAATL
jgi:hypothetical protein